MRSWSTEIQTVGGVAGKESATTSFKSYKLADIGEVLRATREAAIAAGHPKRKIAPVSTYLLERLTRNYFEDYALRGDTLIQIKIEEVNGN
jgi:hypothetical protein